MTSYQQILCPIDGSTTSIRGMNEAANLAKILGAKLRFFHVIDMQSTMIAFDNATSASYFIEALQKNAVEILDQARKFSADHQLDATFGSYEAFTRRVSDAILDEATNCHADLIVIGSNGRRGIKRLLLGSDAEAVARQAPCAVLIVRAEETPERREPAGN